jgi:hypothetical protein
MAPQLHRALLYWRTLRYLKASQIYWRLRYRTRRRRAGRYTAPQPLPTINEEARDSLRGLATHWAANAPPDSARTDAFLLGRFTFLHKTIKSSRPVWTGLDVSKLWLYHLHYFDFARDVALLHPEPDSPGAVKVRAWMLDWVKKNTDCQSVAWDPYPLSVRLINWSIILSVYGWEDFPLRESMHVQLAFLRRHLERDLRGNHLLKNAVAMFIAGTLLNNAHRKAGVALLKREVHAQFLSDGGHAERSPMYHAQALADLILATAVASPNPEWLAGAVERGIAFLHGVTHGDGRSAQFNDGAAEEGLSPATAHALARKFYWGIAAPESSQAYAASGFYRLAAGGDAGLLIVKAGDSTLDHQPGHAHSDLLSFEYSLGGHRVLVNAGTHGYAGSPYRTYCRSTAAHNTVRINGQEQLEHWSVFRVARRVHGRVETWDPIVPALRASYQTRAGQRHERSIAWDARGWWRVLDRIIGRGDLIVESFLHVHPDCLVEGVEEIDLGTYSCRVTAGDKCITLVMAGAGRIEKVQGCEAPCQGWYFPRFGEAVPAPALVLHAAGSDAVSLGYAIVREGASGTQAASDLAQVLAGSMAGE